MMCDHQMKPNAAALCSTIDYELLCRTLYYLMRKHFFIQNEEINKKYSYFYKTEFLSFMLTYLYGIKNSFIKI
jgi:hypothetical protein